MRVRAQREFLHRAVEYLVREAGIRQILDIGCGLPQELVPNVHEIARLIVPETRVVYVDNNLVAVSHMDALHGDGQQTAALQADLREPDDILNHPTTQTTLDYTQPVGVLLVGIVHFLAEEEDPAGLVARLREAVVPGSYVVMSQISAELDPRVHEVVKLWPDRPMVQRGRARVEAILHGWQPVELGIVAVHDWRPDDTFHGEGKGYGVVALRK